jgi:hypothetical protein
MDTKDDKQKEGWVVFAYTRQQALEDGVLIDVTETAREASFHWPVALTRAVWEGFVRVPEGVSCQDEAGRLWDILMLLWWTILGEGSRPDAGAIRFCVHVRNDNRPGTPPLVPLKAVCGPDDHGDPCLTVMLPEED